MWLKDKDDLQMTAEFDKRLSAHEPKHSHVDLKWHRKYAFETEEILIAILLKTVDCTTEIPNGNL